MRELFEEEYARIASEPQFTTLLGSPAESAAREAHQGYFSVDRRKGGGEVLVETKETTDKGRQQAGLAYEQIMRDKVGLTTPGTPIRFIFSHSALQEGWDNPNVFQICVLRNMGTERWRRQSIGRGLRLCVDGSGNRVHGFDINRLTVIANESYEEFADRLQREMAEDLGIQFGVVTVDGFARLTFKAEDGNVVPVSLATAQLLYQALFFEGYIDAKGKVQDSLRQAVQTGDANLTKIVGDAAGPGRGQGSARTYQAPGQAHRHQEDGERVARRSFRNAWKAPSSRSCGTVSSTARSTVSRSMRPTCVTRWSMHCAACFQCPSAGASGSLIA